MSRAFLIFRLLTAALLLLALWNWPYGYYSVLRVCASIAAIEVFWVALEQGRRAWLLPFAAIFILWNPVAQIHLPRGAWQVLDVAAAMLFVLSVPLVRVLPLVPRRGTTRP